jgi:ABC-type phosphate transport system substrate-binding protein
MYKQLLLIVALIISFSTHSISIITNPSVNLPSLTTAQLRRIYSMRQTKWPDQQAIVVYVLPSKHKFHRMFSKKVLQMFPYQLDRIWNKLTYSGVGNGPIVVNSPAELIKAVGNTAGAIGYAEDGVHNNSQLHVISIRRE